MVDRRNGQLPEVFSICLLAGTLLVPTTASGGIKVYEDGDRFVEIGGRVQIQYLRTDFVGDETRDRIFFRRLRPYISGSVTENWVGKLQFDLGKTLDGDEVSVKDAYMQYQGWKNKTLTIGNTKPPFSREFLTSSKRQQTVERGFVGDHNFGTPGRQLGFKLDGQNASKKITYSVSFGGGQHDPDAKKMDFDSPADNRSDGNEGLLIAGRVDFHPWGFVKFDQGDFNSSGIKPNFSLAFFSW
ncbi:MAG: porin, partial [Thermoanaerobaculia bacterium]